MTFRSIFLGTAAVSLIATGAVAADLPDKMEPAEYVQVCDVHGSGFFRLPGYDTCLRVGGDVRARYNFVSTGEETTTTGDDEATTGDADSSVNYNARGRVNIDARTQSDWGTVRAFTKISGSAGDGTKAEISDAFMQVGNLAAGKTGSFSNLTYGAYAFNNNHGPYDADNSPWLIGYSMPVGYGVTISASVESAVGSGFGDAVGCKEEDASETCSALSTENADYKSNSLSSKLIPDVGVGAELAQGWGKVGVVGGLHPLFAEASAVRDNEDTAANEAAQTDGEDPDPTDLTGFGFFGGGGVEINVLSTTKVGATGFYGIGALSRIGASGGIYSINDAIVRTPTNDAGDAEADDEILPAAGFSANGGITHSFSSDFAFHVNGGFLSVSDGQDAKDDPVSVTGFMAGGSFDYNPVANVTFSVGGEFASFTKTTDVNETDDDPTVTRSDFAVTANISQSF